MPVRRSITAATRGKVHRSVVNPCAGAPRRKAPSSPANSAAVNRGFRPARPAPFRPRWPATFQAAYQRHAVIGVTANVRVTAACDSPRANRRAASNRRASNPAKSRRAPRGVPIPQRGIVAHVLHNSISRDYLVGPALPSGDVGGNAHPPPVPLRPHVRVAPRSRLAVRLDVGGARVNDGNLAQHPDPHVLALDVLDRARFRDLLEETRAILEGTVWIAVHEVLGQVLVEPADVRFPHRPDVVLVQLLQRVDVPRVRDGARHAMVSLALSSA